MGERLRVALAGDQRGQHLSTRDPEDVRGDRAELDLGVLKQTLLTVRGILGRRSGGTPGPARIMATASIGLRAGDAGLRRQ
jgi:hypothetical protein